MKTNGGPAFPFADRSRQTSQDGYVWHQGVHPGMTLRDYFAAAALQGLLAKEGSTAEIAFIAYAECAYKYADAMLAERAKAREPS